MTAWSEQAAHAVPQSKLYTVRSLHIYLSVFHFHKLCDYLCNTHTHTHTHTQTHRAEEK